MDKLKDLTEKVENAVAIKCYTSDEAEMVKNAIEKVSILPLLSETFMCLICLDVLTPPVILGRCCRRLISCKRCNDVWLTRTCPHCRSANYEVVELACFDDLLNKFRELNTTVNPSE